MPRPTSLRLHARIGTTLALTFAAAAARLPAPGTPAWFRTLWGDAYAPRVVPVEDTTGNS